MFDEDEDEGVLLIKKIIVYTLIVFVIGVGVYFAIELVFWLLGLMGKFITHA